MRSPGSWLLGMGVFGALLVGCARGPDVQAPALALRRVVIYRNGVAYFERAGHVETDQVTFRVRKEKVGDFLATLAVMETGGSSVRSASFPIELDRDRQAEAEEEVADRRYEILLKPPPGKRDKEKDNMEKVTLSLDGREHDLLVGYVAETPVWRPSYRLVIEDKKEGGSKQADLQAWGVVQNQSGEDWKGVQLSLIAGAPLAFQAMLHQPIVPPRPIVSDAGEVFGAIPTGETSFAQLEGAAPMAAPAPPPAEARTAYYDRDGDGLADDEEQLAEESEAPYDKRRPMKKAELAASTTRGPRASATPMGGMGGGSGGPMFDRGVMPSGPRNVSALAAVAMQGGTTRYDVPFTVDIPDKSATMVLLVAKRVPGEAMFMFSPDGGVPESSQHPFRVARFTNDTNGLLERGPIAVFANGAFLGQGLVEPIPAGGSATVPFALERAIGVDRSSDFKAEGARIAKIEAGNLEIDRDFVTLTKYTIKNGDEADARVLVRHPRTNGARLVDAPKETEDNVGTGFALVPITVAKHATGTLTVDERASSRQYTDWMSQLADEAVKGYIADSRADKTIVQQLTKAWEVRAKVRTARDEEGTLYKEKNIIEHDSDLLRRDLRSVEKATGKQAEALRKNLTERLAKNSARLDELTRKLISVGLTIRENEIAFRDAVNGIKLLNPLPPPAGK